MSLEDLLSFMKQNNIAIDDFPNYNESTTPGEIVDWLIDTHGE